MSSPDTADEQTEAASLVWTQPAFRARAANQRAGELKAQYDAEMDIRDRAIRESVDGGAPVAKLAAMVGLSRSTVYCIIGTEPAA